jgi:hypothetical protein
MTAPIAQYTGLVTSEHAQQPNFLAVLSMAVQPLADLQAVLTALPSEFSIQTAVGAQLDIVGLWVGQSRYLAEPLTNVYFSWDTTGLGWDQGNWQGPYDPSTGLVALPDDQYRQLLLAKIANNQWDGTIPGAYEFMDPVFPGNTFFIQDRQDMGMYVGVTGSAPLTAVTYALLTGGYLTVQPAGVKIFNFVTPSVLGAPLFGFDVENSTISGFDVGVWGTLSPGV